MFNTQAGLARDTATNFANEARERQTVTSGTRSGAARGTEFEIGSRLGQALAQIRGDTDIQLAQKDRQDELQAIGQGLNIAGVIDALTGRTINTQLGVGQLLGQISGQPTPASQVGSGVGGILGAATGGITGNSKLFK